MSLPLMMHSRKTGFTLVELISVMVIIGVIALVALPRFFERQTYDARRFYEQTISVLRYAQKAAIAQRRLVCVSFPNNTSITLTIAAANPETPAGSCNGNPLSGPTGGSPYTVTAPDGVTYSTTPTSFNFSALGRPTSLPGTIQITGASQSITVEAETGYVH